MSGKSKKSAATKPEGTGSKSKTPGRKLAIYVPSCDEYVIMELTAEQERHNREGYRTSLSFELIRVAKIGLVALRDEKILKMVEKAIKE